MILDNLAVTVKEVTDTSVEVSDDSGRTIVIPRSLLPNAIKGSNLHISIDLETMVSKERHAKDVLNEIVKK